EILDGEWRLEVEKLFAGGQYLRGCRWRRFSGDGRRRDYGRRFRRGLGRFDLRDLRQHRVLQRRWFPHARSLWLLVQIDQRENFLGLLRLLVLLHLPCFRRFLRGGLFRFFRGGFGFFLFVRFDSGSSRGGFLTRNGFESRFDSLVAVGGG